VKLSFLIHQLPSDPRSLAGSPAKDCGSTLVSRKKDSSTGIKDSSTTRSAPTPHYHATNTPDVPTPPLFIVLSLPIDHYPAKAPCTSNADTDMSTIKITTCMQISHEWLDFLSLTLHKR
jgi:hypothetical protein